MAVTQATIPVSNSSSTSSTTLTLSVASNRNPSGSYSIVSVAWDPTTGSGTPTISSITDTLSGTWVALTGYSYPTTTTTLGTGVRTQTWYRSTAGSGTAYTATITWSAAVVAKVARQYSFIGIDSGFPTPTVASINGASATTIASMTTPDITANDLVLLVVAQENVGAQVEPTSQSGATSWNGSGGLTVGTGAAGVGVSMHTLNTTGYVGVSGVQTVSGATVATAANYAAQLITFYGFRYARTGTASISLVATATASLKFPATGSAAIDISATGTGQLPSALPATGTASISIDATVSVGLSDLFIRSGSGAIELVASGSGTLNAISLGYPATGTANISIVASASATIAFIYSATGTASISIAGTMTATVDFPTKPYVSNFYSTTSFASGTTTTLSIGPSYALEKNIVLIAFDNNSSVQTITGVTDTHGNTYTPLISQLSQPATQGNQDGLIYAAYISDSVTDATTNTITVTNSVSVTSGHKRAVQVYKVLGITQTQPTSATTRLSTTISATWTSPIKSWNNILFSAMGIEASQSSVSGTVDISGETWSTVNWTRAGGTTTAGLDLASQYKVLTTSGTESLRWTGSASSDNIEHAFILSYDSAYKFAQGTASISIVATATATLTFPQTATAVISIGASATTDGLLRYPLVLEGLITLVAEGIVTLTQSDIPAVGSANIGLDAIGSFDTLTLSLGTGTANIDLNGVITATQLKLPATASGNIDLTSTADATVVAFGLVGWGIPL